MFKLIYLVQLNSYIVQCMFKLFALFLLVSFLEKLGPETGKICRFLAPETDP